MVDTSSGRLAARADDFLPLAQARLGSAVASELNLCQIEVGTPICTTLDEVRHHLTEVRTGMEEAGRSAGLTIAAAATHPIDSWREQAVDVANDRYRRMENVYQVVAREQIICGLHVHVGFEDRDLAVQVMNRSRAWLPVLLALTANSPFWEGADSGYDSYRLQVWQRWPTSGMPPWLASAGDYDTLVEQLIQMDAIEDASFLYWYVRPSSHFPTLEYRPCDVCLTVDDAVTVTDLIRALAWTCARDVQAGAPTVVHGRDALSAAMWRVSRYGLDGGLVSPDGMVVRPAEEVVAGMLDYVGEALDFLGDRDEVEAGARAILEHGNGARRQRAAFGQHLESPDSLAMIRATQSVTRR